MPASPSPLNYFIGKGILSFKRDGESVYRDLGNAPTVEFTPELTQLDHFSSRTGVRSKDRSVVTEKSGTVHIILEEFSPENLAIALLGTIDTNSDGKPSIKIFDGNAVGGALRLVGTNEVGPKFQWDFARVEFIPSAALGAISDEWGQIDLTGNAVAVDGEFGTVDLISDEGEEDSESA